MTNGKKGQTDLLKQFDFCKRCPHKVDYEKLGLSSKYDQKDVIFCGKLNKHLPKAKLRDVPVFCDRGA
jgi:hypothetical protein